MYYAKIGGFLCYMAPFFIVLFNEKMLDYVYPVFNAAAMLKGLELFDIYGMKGDFLLFLSIFGEMRPNSAVF